MDCSTPGFPVHHQLLEVIQTHAHQVSDAIQPSHSLSSPSPPALNLSQHQSFPMSQFFTSGGQSIGVSASAPVLPMNIQDWFPLGWTAWIFLKSKGLSRVFFNTTVQKHQFFGALFTVWKGNTLIRYNSIVTMLYMRSPELIHLMTKGLSSLTNMMPLFSPIPQPKAATLLLSDAMGVTFLDSTDEWGHTILVFLRPA